MTGTVKRNPPIPVFTDSIKRVRIDWTSTAGGAAVDDSMLVNGTLLGVAFFPGSGGTQPTNGYSVTLLDDEGIDVLNNAGSTLSNATATRAIPTVGTTGLPPVLAGSVSLNVSGAGNAKTGYVVLYLR